MVAASIFDSLPAASRVQLTDRDRLEAISAASYGPSRANFISAAPGFVASGHVVRAESVGFTHMRASDPLDLTFEHMSTYGQIFHIAGESSVRSGRQVASIGSARGAVANAGQRFDFARGGGSECVTINIAPSAVLSKLGALVGDTPPKRCAFEMQSNTADASLQYMLRTTMLLASVSFEMDGRARELIVSELEQTAIVGFLFGNVHPFRQVLERPERDPAPWQVRLAEAYIETHWEDPLTIETLVEVTGVSTRSLFAAFQKTRGYSPMMFVKRVRLRKARERLAAGPTPSSVTDVAYACGFGNLGHFASAYHRAFGERPSQTLAKARGAAQAAKTLRRGTPAGAA